ncbi:hypothetical protein [Priestia megaterium]|uniref:hypothetical protein n=1 Tax=Priestia megaterium TaxID=1404 RepID=UPI00204C1C4B|nr:hypothetical protein [Priestia megaterium]MCU7741370.1 hypothetical protein [Priestia megaterium]UOO43868.1 hypothetical protein I0292_26175 [Priestia megaterium]
MLFNKDLVLASIKAVGEDHAIVQYRDQEVEVNLSPEEAKEFHQYVLHQENMLVPMNIKTQKLFVDLEEPWYEQELEELKGISYQEEEGEDE